MKIRIIFGLSYIFVCSFMVETLNLLQKNAPPSYYKQLQLKLVGYMINYVVPENSLYRVLSLGPNLLSVCYKYINNNNNSVFFLPSWSVFCWSSWWCARRALCCSSLQTSANKMAELLRIFRGFSETFHGFLHYV